MDIWTTVVMSATFGGVVVIICVLEKINDKLDNVIKNMDAGKKVTCEPTPTYKPYCIYNKLDNITELLIRFLGSQIGITKFKVSSRYVGEYAIEIYDPLEMRMMDHIEQWFKTYDWLDWKINYNPVTCKQFIIIKERENSNG